MKRSVMGILLAGLIISILGFSLSAAAQDSASRIVFYVD